MDTLIAVIVVAGAIGLLYFIKSRRAAAKDAGGSGTSSQTTKLD